MHALDDSLLELLELPRGRQAAALEELLASLPEPAVREEWNTAFGPGSLFEAWTSTSLAASIYAANRALLRPLLDERPDWRAVEVGAGNGELWSRMLTPEDRGELVAIDPVPQALDELRRRVPEGVKVETREGRVEALGPLPEADVVVCSLTLHHVAGRSREERREHGLEGDGKGEVLRAFREAVAPRRGLVVINEADIHCEVDLPPGDPLLRERLLDSYVRRCARAILDDLRRPDASEDLKARWRHVIQRWCLEQVRLAEVPVAERDVYELDAGRWRDELGRAGLEVVSSRCTDEAGLFFQHVGRAS